MLDERHKGRKIFFEQEQRPLQKMYNSLEPGWYRIKIGGIIV
jgi:hypothetical protein